MWFFRKKKSIEEDTESIRRNNIRRAEKALGKIKKPTKLLEDYKDDPTMMIFLATGGDKRGKR